MIIQTPNPPYFAVIFTSLKTPHEAGYDETAILLESLAKEQPGFLGMESVRDGLGITVSYWSDLESIRQWKNQADHRIAQEMGKKQWYQSYRVRIARVEREYGFENEGSFT